MKPYLLGVMQGRLLPKYQGRYQAHPVGYWQEEFPIAADLSLDLIEFILDYNDAELNPLMSKAGLEEIASVSAKTGVAVRSICADYFMEAPLHSLNDKVAAKSVEILQWLIERGYDIGVTDIVIPCVDASTLDNPEAIERFCKRMQKPIKTAERVSVNLALETDLAPATFSKLLGKLNSSRVTVNYDIGNSAALGYSPSDELATYGRCISDIHIKDRIRVGGSVTLGSGSADFDSFFNALTTCNYNGIFIMQAYRDDEGVTEFKRQLEWIRPKLEKWATCGGVR